MRSHRSQKKLASGLTLCNGRAIPWTGVVYRSASVRYATRSDLLAGRGAKRFGARWNPPRSIATIYASLDIETAVQEALAHHRYYGLPVAQALPRVLIAIEALLSRILDLTDTQVRRNLGVTRQELLSEDWRALNDRGREALTQALGRLAGEAGWEGLLVPSAANRSGVNLVIFRENLAAPTTSLRIIKADELPVRP